MDAKKETIFARTVSTSKGMQSLRSRAYSISGNKITFYSSSPYIIKFPLVCFFFFFQPFPLPGSKRTMRKMRIHTHNLRQKKPLTWNTGLVPGPHFPRESFSDKGGEQYRMTVKHTSWNMKFQHCYGKLLTWSLTSGFCSHLIQYVQVGQNSYFTKALECFLS